MSTITKKIIPALAVAGVMALMTGCVQGENAGNADAGDGNSSG